MNLYSIMKENDIELELLFTLAKLNDKEGLMFFESVIETIDESNESVTNLVPKYILIDNAKFIYDEEMDNKIVINSIDKIINFTRIDGYQINIDLSIISGFPFKVEQFKNKVFDVTTTEQNLMNVADK